MNTWRKTAFGLVLAMALGGVGGCGGDDGGGAGTGGDPALVGHWRMSSMSVNNSGYFPPGEIGWDVQLQLNDDGSATATEVWQGKTESAGGGWSTSGNQLNVAVGWYNWTGPYTVSANQFTLSNVANYDDEGDTGSFIFTRM